MNVDLKPSEVLAKAADLIEPEGAWTQSVRARDTAGRWVDALELGAVCWCLVGAVQRVTGRAGSEAYAAPELNWVASVVRRRDPASWNDAQSRRQATVVSALRAASELAKAEGQ